MSTLLETHTCFAVEELEQQQLTSSLPFRVKLRANDEHGKLLDAYSGEVTLSAVSSKTCLAEGFERKTLGRWCVAAAAA
jgi:hypothetical protein